MYRTVVSVDETLVIVTVKIPSTGPVSLASVVAATVIVAESLSRIVVLASGVAMLTMAPVALAGPDSETANTSSISTIASSTVPSVTFKLPAACPFAVAVKVRVVPSHV